MKRECVIKIIGSTVPSAQVEFGIKDHTYYGEVVANTIRFTSAWNTLTDQQQLYVVLHEVCHLLVGLWHNDIFYRKLEELIMQYRIDWHVARTMEQIYPCEWDHR